MSITVGRGSNSTTQTVADATWTDILSQAASAYIQCEAIVVANLSTSGAPLKVAAQQKGNPGDTIHRIGVTSANVPDDWWELAAGESVEFVGSIDNKIVRVMVSGSGGTATCKWTVSKA